ncbi:MAG TPA: serine/threonine-protein kinase [Bryobacteraceae bacterium]|nr:serine/threonine-protein kinase [Bryobacteraceae bacterium]
MNVDKLCVSCMEDDSGSPICPKCGAQFSLSHTNLLLLPPRTLLHQQYVIGRALGHGGFGVTYLAWDTGLQIRLAIKEYMPSGVASRSTPNTVHAASDRMKDEYEWGLDRFLEEARVLKKFSNHPNIVAVDTIFRDNGTAYMVMEYLEGMTFEEFVAQRGGKVSFETSLRIMVPVIDTLAVVHGEGILHRDISPDNIHIAKTGKVKLMDFGAARNALSQKSRNLSVILKEGYAPEEQYRSSGIQGPWTDVYATGATLYHSITGKLPPPALDRAAEDNISTPSQLGVAIPSSSERALMKALAVRSLDRYQSMEDFKAGLTETVSAAPVPVALAPVSTQPPQLPTLTAVPPTQPPAMQPPAMQPPPMQPPAMQSPAMPPPVPTQQGPIVPPPVTAPPPAPQFQPPLPFQQNVPAAPASSSPSRKWLIPVVAIGLIVLAAAAAVTLKFGPDLLSRPSNKEDSVVKNQPPSSPPPAEPSPAPATPPEASAPQAQAPPPAAPEPAAPKASSPKPPRPAAATQTDEDRQRQLEQQKSAPPPPSPVEQQKPPVDSAPAAHPTSGILRYSGPPVPLNGKVTFQNLPAARLRFTFDHDAWQPVISRQANGSQTLILVSKKQGLQSKCEVRWELAP